MRLQSLILLAVVGCGHSHDEGGGAILVNDASDEVFVTFSDLEGEIVADNTEAAYLTMPAEAAFVPAATPATFAWSFPPTSRRPRHGVASGTFFWLQYTGEGLAGPVDVLVVNAMQWTPTSEQWERIAAASGSVTVRLVTCTFDDGVRVPGEGPWRHDPNATFSLQR